MTRLAAIGACALVLAGAAAGTAAAFFAAFVDAPQHVTAFDPDAVARVTLAPASALAAGAPAAVVSVPASVAAADAPVHLTVAAADPRVQARFVLDTPKDTTELGPGEERGITVALVDGSVPVTTELLVTVRLPDGSSWTRRAPVTAEAPGA